MVSTYGLDISWFFNMTSDIFLPKAMFQNFFKLLDFIYICLYIDKKDVQII